MYNSVSKTVKEKQIQVPSTWNNGVYITFNDYKVCHGNNSML